MATHELITRIEIAAPVERVWSILADFTQYPRWNPFIRSVSGIARRGERLRVSIQPKGRRAMTFRPRVLGAADGQELRWLGSLGFRGLFGGEHYFLLENLGAGHTRFTQGEKFSGLLVGYFVSQMEKQTQAGFEAMNRALKDRAESGMSQR